MFVDIDFPQLIASKVRVILETPQLLDLLSSPATAKEEDILPFRTKHYIALGCDLANTADLNDALMNVIDLKSHRVLCMAEVSITYMNTVAADSLIRWAGLLPDGKCKRLLKFLSVMSLILKSSLLLIGAILTRWATSSICTKNAQTLRESTDTVKVYSILSESRKSARSILVRWMVISLRSQSVGAMERFDFHAIRSEDCSERSGTF